MKKLLTIFTLCLAATLGGCTQAPKPQPRPLALVQVETVEKNSVGAPVSTYSASIDAYSRVQLTFRGQGYITSIHLVKEPDGSTRLVDQGDEVTAGTVLACLRPADFQNLVNSAQSQMDRTVAGVQQSKSQVLQAQAAEVSARAAVKQAEAAEGEARAQVAAAQADYDNNRANYDRAVNLLASESMAQSDYDSAKAACDSSKARLDQTKQQIYAAQAQLRSVRAKVGEAVSSVGMSVAALNSQKAAVLGSQSQLDQAKLNYSDAFLKAPFSGVILDRNVELGTQVTPGTVAFEIVALDTVKVTFGVPDMVVNHLRIGQKVDVICDALPGKLFHGRILTLAAGADPKERTFQVVVKLANTNHLLRVGMIASLDLTTTNRKAMVELSIPLSSIVEDPNNPGQYCVYIVEGQGNNLMARLRRIKTGEAIGDRITIKEGISHGDRVVTSGLQLIKDGDPIKIGD
ncbi:MAG: efflux RND transporter periplasmic adaptor subunit [bacterium]